MEYRPILLTMALLFTTGCASFTSGDTRIPKKDLKRMLSDKEIKPAAELRVTWENFPYKNAIDTIGEGRAQPEAPAPVPVPIKDMAWLQEHAREIFGEAGLYDAQNGTGTITLALTSYGRWTYRELFSSFLVDTGWIFIFPATLRVNHHLAAEFTGPDMRAAAEELVQSRTTFHALLFPLYPFFPPGAKEHSLLKKMLWKSAADVYARIKRGGTPVPAGASGASSPKTN
jgi:hypothetical protein